jgi:dihydrofolate reductase
MTPGRSFERCKVSGITTGTGKVVVNRAMSLDGFIAAPGDSMDWIFESMRPVGEEFPEIMAATGAMLVGRRTHDTGKRMAANADEATADYEATPAYDGGAVFVLTHRPPELPDPGVTFLTGDVGAAVATALRAAGGKNLEILGSDVAAQCLRAGLVDELLVYVVPVLLGDGTRFFSAPGLDQIDLEPLDSIRAGTVTILRFRVRK